MPADPRNLDRDREQAKAHGYDLLAPIDAAYADGQIDQDEWHRRVLAIVEPAYLAGDERMGSGHSGTADEWERSRSIVMEAIDRDGTFLDVGCANGLLMASVHRWSVDRGRRVEPYGIDISAAFADLARSRYPQWAQRIWHANAASWQPPMRFDLVRTGLEYVPIDRRPDFVQHLVDHVVAPGGRLIVGKTNEDRGVPGIAATLRSWGWPDVHEVRRPHDHPDIEQTLVWFDPPG
ncbi:trans-aconitate 2-methyltransferase [Branchiibius sp. NY16-3462-2]|uniref:class I SAM-dependent methyltransferase n=1 Tax=Branchiibius sp. NY16-3462-2 TaxID=1807500 RepID=UPI0007947B10|nr:class I SAM-dependent methyltransferase [Branchiibius sp. NY16-3462-2]KYH44655.1 hypothetical protein AZH51_00340 [Branchiibius sp. NY16-3462-2]